jgi:hypothetical protein
MRTFHIGGAASRAAAVNSIDIKNSGSVRQHNHTLWDYLETHQPVWRDYALSKLGHLVVA